MSQNKKEIEGLFRVLRNTNGVLTAFLLSSDANMHLWDNENLNNDSDELKLFMESIRFLEKIDQNTVLNYKSGHWKFQDRVLSLYSINENKLLLLYKTELSGEAFDNMILDVLLTL